MNPTFKSAKEILKKISHQWGLSILITQALIVVVFPIIEILLSISKVEISGGIWFLIGSLHLIIAIYSIAGVLKLNDFLDLSDINQLDEKFKTLENSIESGNVKINILFSQINEHIRQQVDLQTSLRILTVLLNSDEKKPTANSISILLAPLIKDRAEALEYRNVEYYNFVVYLFHQQDKTLRIFFRNCDERITRHDRVWKVGVGHVGVCFARNETLLKSDAISDEQYKGDFSFGTDNEYYRSYISSPIFGKDSKKGPLGVFEITSSRPDHFTNEDEQIVESYALLFSLYFSKFIK